jgi:hypothetical protein
MTLHSYVMPACRGEAAARLAPFQLIRRLPPAGAIPPPAVKETEFPSLGMAAAVKETKKDKKKKTMSLADFNSAPFGAGRIGRRAVPDDNSILLSLPTAPRQREEGDEPDDRPTGGFRTYGERWAGDRSFFSRTLLLDHPRSAPGCRN